MLKDVQHTKTHNVLNVGGYFPNERVITLIILARGASSERTGGGQ